VIEEHIVNFNKNGYYLGEFKDTDSLRDLKSSLQEISDNKVKDTHFLESKYRSTKDLRPNAFDYSSSILKVIFDNDIDQYIDQITQRDMLLGHVQIRSSDAGNSYMPWHRDVYATRDRNVGMYPPAVKLIYYLDQENSEKKIELLEGSHRISLNHMQESEYILPGFSKFDNQLFSICPKIDYANIGNNFLLFDTSILHSVSDTKSNSIRIIYSFATEYQIEKTFKKGDHVKLSQIYKGMK
jgi:hypothetical protein